MKTAIEFLADAEDMLDERGREYDKADGERSMERAVEAFNAITRHDLKESEGWLFMQMLKDARQWQSGNYHHDSALDGVAYSALKSEALYRGR